MKSWRNFVFLIISSQNIGLIEYSRKLEVPDFIKNSQILDDCITALENLHTLNTPTKKLNCLVTMVNSISTGFIFLANKTGNFEFSIILDDQASVDDILHLLCYIILSSSAENLMWELKYWEIFYFFTDEEKYGKTSFWLKNLEIALEYLKSIVLKDERMEDDDFEICIDETEI